jgi:parallel beta-helix repeat protein
MAQAATTGTCYPNRHYRGSSLIFIREFPPVARGYVSNPTYGNFAKLPLHGLCLIFQGYCRHHQSGALESLRGRRERNEDLVKLNRIKHHAGRTAAYRTLLLGLTVIAQCSADVYIAQGTSASSTGQSCNDALPASWFNNIANWGSGGKQIGPGTTVHLCGSISSNLTVQGSGSSGAPVTILFEPDAKLSQAAGGPFITMSGKSFIVVDGGRNGIIENTAAATSQQHVSSQGILANPCADCEVKNLTIQNLYVHSGSDTEIEQTQSNCIVYSGDNFKIHDNTMHDVGWCIYLQGQAVNNRIYNNNVYNIDHAIILSPTGKGAAAGPLYIYSNHIHDYANWDNASNRYHHDGIHCYTVPSPYPQPAGPPAEGAHWNDLWLYNNLFDGNIGQNVTGHIFLEPGVQTDGYATPCMDSTSNVHIFGNVLMNGTTLNGTIDLGRSSTSPLTVPIDFFNNTIIGSSAAEGRAVVFENVQSVNAINNILGGANKLWDGVSFVNTDYNGYVNCPAGVSYNCWPVAGGTNNFTTWRSISASDAHGVNSQNDFGGVNSVTGAPGSGSVMVGSGLNLAGTVAGWPAEQRSALANDLNGMSRGSGRWDIGALAFGSATTPPPVTPPQPPAPPTALTAVGH